MRTRKFNTAIFLLCITGCATTPTGRKQLILVPDDQMGLMGSQAFDQMKQQLPQENNSPSADYVRCVANAVAARAEDPTGVKHWEVVVFKDESANAFALPGGKIGVHTGMLKVATTPDQLAAVLGHEVGHVIARHGAERVTQAGLAETALQMTSAMTGTGTNHDLLMAALGIGAQYGFLMPHGRKQESEADKIGLDLMAKAGFDPRESVELWKNMSRAGGSGPPEFLSTHPSHDRRIHDLQSNMDEALKIYNQRRSQGALPQCKGDGV
jgi:predicted Zn-dependent protease